MQVSTFCKYLHIQKQKNASSFNQSVLTIQLPSQLITFFIKALYQFPILTLNQKDLSESVLPFHTALTIPITIIFFFYYLAPFLFHIISFPLIPSLFLFLLFYFSLISVCMQFIIRHSRHNFCALTHLFKRKKICCLSLLKFYEQGGRGVLI